jgi:hypothetical protein
VTASKVLNVPELFPPGGFSHLDLDSLISIDPHLPRHISPPHRISSSLQGGGISKLHSGGKNLSVGGLNDLLLRAPNCVEIHVVAVDDIITSRNLGQLAEERVSIKLKGDFPRLKGNNAILYLSEKTPV